MKPRLDKYSKGTAGRHETFVPRYGWLTKGYVRCAESPHVFNDDAVEQLGVGKNMVRSIRFWCILFGLLKVSCKDSDLAKGSLLLGKLGIRLIGQYLPDKNRVDTETGWDPYLEDIASLWLCAGKFSSSHSTQCPGRRHSTSVRFSPSRSRNLELPLSTSPRMMPVWPQFPPVLMKRMQHVSFIRTHNQQKIGNEIRCPFNALGLIESIPENGHFRFAVGKQNTLPSLIFLAACFSYAESLKSSTRTLSLNQIVYGADSPCIAFKITETECGRLLEQRSIH